MILVEINPTVQTDGVKHLKHINDKCSIEYQRYMIQCSSIVNFDYTV